MQASKADGLPIAVEQMGAARAPFGLPATDAELARRKARGGKLGWTTITIYGIGGLSEHVVGFGLASLLLFYLTVVCGLPGSAAGLAMGLAMILDAVIQPVMGSLSDNSRSRRGRRLPFMVAGAIPMTIGLGLLYSVPSSFTGTGLFVYVFLVLVCMRIAHAVFNVPYIALGAELSDDYHERSLIVASRLLSGSLGGLLATFLAYGVFMKGHEGQAQRAAYAPFAWSCAAIAGVGVVISIWGAHRVRDRLNVATSGQAFSVKRFLREIVELFRNPSFRPLFFVAIGSQVAWGAASALQLHANTYFWNLATSQILMVGMLGTSGYLVGCLVGAILGRRLEKRTTAIIGMSLTAVCQLSLVPLSLLGMIPHEAVLPMVAGATFVGQAGLSILLVNFQSMVADAADEHDQIFGARREGLFYAGSSVAAFASNGVGSIIAGVTLDLIGFPHIKGGSHGAHLNVPIDTVHKLGLVYGPGAGIITVLGIIGLLGYRLNKAKHAAIRDALNERN